jgi:hypothetical protein
MVLEHVPSSKGSTENISKYFPRGGGFDRLTDVTWGEKYEKREKRKRCVRKRRKRKESGKIEVRRVK